MCFAALAALYFAMLLYLVLILAGPFFETKSPVHGLHGVRPDYVQVHFRCYVMS